jgi:Tol biopolymer transport system component
MRRPRFSPDGQFIAFVTVADNFRDPIDIGIVDVSGNLVTRIPIPATVAAWSPDGARLAYGLESEAGGGLWITDLEGNTEQILDTHDIATSLRWGEAGILTTVREAGAIGNHSVAIIDPEDGTIVELLDTEWTDPTWGPGGDVLVVQRSSGQLFGRNSTGEFYGPLVTGPQRVQEPAWTP